MVQVARVLFQGTVLGYFRLGNISWYLSPAPIWTQIAGGNKLLVEYQLDFLRLIWLWVNTNGIPFWGRCTTHFRTYFSGDVHWGYGILTHGRIPANRV